MAATACAEGDAPAFPVPRIPCAPRTYVCPRAGGPVVVDGRLDDPAWNAAPWTEEFTDIEGPSRPAPRYHTRARMLWDETFLYVAATLEEPDLWGTYDRRDSIIYHENDFEVFIDPDGDTHEYYELEINARNTVWDLLLVRPYRDGGPAVHAWDIAGLQTAVALEGTLNEGGDRDAGWSVEIAIPWEILKECAHRDTPPAAGDQWRVNFSRVEWPLERDGSGYRKPDGAREDNWVWSPQGLVAMHYPEMWGIVQFVTSPGDSFLPDPDAGTRWALRLLYYAQKDRAERGDVYSGDPAALHLHGLPSALRLTATPSGYEAVLPSAAGGTLHIDETGRLVRRLP
jgi:hypothetical protein